MKIGSPLTGKWYVTMTDSFMSDWGMAEGKKNKLIFVCADQSEAEIVAENAINRGDMTRVKIHQSAPVQWRNSGDIEGYAQGNYWVQIKNRSVYPSWYKKNFFKKDSL